MSRYPFKRVVHCSEYVEVQNLKLYDRILLDDSWDKSKTEYQVIDIYPSVRQENYIWVIGKNGNLEVTQELLKKTYLIERAIDAN